MNGCRIAAVFLKLYVCKDKFLKSFNVMIRECLSIDRHFFIKTLKHITLTRTFGYIF